MVVRNLIGQYVEHTHYPSNFGSRDRRRCRLTKSYYAFRVTRRMVPLINDNLRLAHHFISVCNKEKLISGHVVIVARVGQLAAP